MECAKPFATARRQVLLRQKAATWHPSFARAKVRVRLLALSMLRR